MGDVTKRLVDLCIPPELDGPKYHAWLEPDDAFTFLADNQAESEFVVYAGLLHAFIHAIFVPLKSLEPLDVEDLLRWNGNPWTSWGMTYSFADPPQLALSAPLDGISSKTLAAGEQFVFGRTFDGRLDERSYFDILQKFIHIFDLHYLSHRHAYCRFDEHGDIQDSIKILSIDGQYGGSIITVDRRILDEYMVLTGSVIARMFDFTRLRVSEFNGWGNDLQEKIIHKPDLYYRSAVQKGHASYARGVEIVRSIESESSLVSQLQGHAEVKQYASFIAYDWKNKLLGKISCDPQYLSNYFTESQLPFETTPAFFRAEVLLRYKADPSKYEMTARSITCRNAWHLQTYDINEAGQVHTYLLYLSRLPYQEQAYWLAFNEAPKAPISKRAYTTDFLGEFHTDYDPLESLKHALRELISANPAWWKLRSPDLIDQISYPVTQSFEEWSNELMTLDKILIEGLEEKFLRRKAEILGRQIDPRFRSLRLLQECLIGLGFDDDHSKNLLSPMHDVHNLRSLMKGHANGGEAKETRAALLAKFGTYRKQFEAICTGCDEAVRCIVKAFELPPSQA
jgi:hypothetical protein